MKVLYSFFSLKNNYAVIRRDVSLEGTKNGQ